MRSLAVLVFFAAALTLSPGSAFVMMPGDNSQYVEGQSRYIWMPDGQGTPQLVDLQIEADLSRTPFDGRNNKYFLYTRRNPNTTEYLSYKNESSVVNSNFTFGLPLRVIVHGWNNDGTSTLNTLLTAAFLTVEDVNVICVDWSEVAREPYTTSAAKVPSVGEYLGYFLIWLLDLTGGSWDDVHMVGHSLGAHVAGTAGRTVNGSIIRLTGMDPAGPGFVGNANALNTSSAQYVETINTDGGMLGIFYPLGHGNFYPNGGRNPQPGCTLSACSHGRSYQLMAATIYYNHKIGLSCTNLQEAGDDVCTGSRQYMGNDQGSKKRSGLFSLATGFKWPY